MLVRRETDRDQAAVRRLVGEVLSAPLLDGLRTSDAWLPALSFVALGSEDEVVGHVAATRGHIGSRPTLALLPPSVDPNQRGQGVGQALMHSVLGAAEALDEQLVALMGFPPEYYLRFGFRPADEYAISAPVAGWQSDFLVRPLTAWDGSLRGTFTFPDPFLEVSDG